MRVTPELRTVLLQRLMELFGNDPNDYRNIRVTSVSALTCSVEIKGSYQTRSEADRFDYPSKSKRAKPANTWDAGTFNLDFDTATTSDQFPDCCGYDVVSNFDNWLAPVIFTLWVKALRSCPKVLGGNGALLAATIPSQNATKGFEAAGLVPIAKTRNTSTRLPNLLWALVLNPVLTRKPTKK